MAIVIALGIAMAVFAFVAAPFFLGNNREERADSDSGHPTAELQDLLAEKETIYAAIQELDFDLKSGKLSPEDHGALRQRHEAQAAGVLRRIEEMQGVPQAPEKSRTSRREKRKK